MVKTNLRVVCGFIFIMLISCNDNSKDKSQAVLPADSKESLKMAIRNYPDSLLLVQNLIEAYSDEGSYDSALAITDAQIKKDSNNAYLWNMKATLHFENNDTVNAINALEHAVDIYPLPQYLVALGTIYAEVKNQKALIIANGLLRANRVKSGADAMFLKGLYYSYTDDKYKAINYFDSSLHMDFTYMFSYREKAIALYDLEKYKDALEVLKRAVTVQNNFDEGYYWMGRCYEKLDSTNNAIQNFQMALLYDKNFTEARAALDSLQNKSQ
jgi:tetratricopeptide (TPR) repeat protein